MRTALALGPTNERRISSSLNGRDGEGDPSLNMETPGASPRRRVSLADCRGGPAGPLLHCEDPFEVGGVGDPSDQPAEESRDLVFAGYRLQEIADYRAAIQSWFKALRVGGRLAIVVPHAFLYERLLALPGRWDPAQRRLYTPASLMSEVEEALEPNSYRVRWLSDDDAGYDYGLDREIPPAGAADVLLVLERIAVPRWGLTETPRVKAFDPDYEFEPNRTRVEFVSTAPRSKILILKLDHLGDFIMGIPALEKARATFADAEITLVVGAWNLDIARQMNVADKVPAVQRLPQQLQRRRGRCQGQAGAVRGARHRGVRYRHRSSHRHRHALSVEERAGGSTRRGGAARAPRFPRYRAAAGLQP